MSKILGISAFYHDSAAALVVDGEIIAAAQEERFTRNKNDASYPENAIKFALAEAGLSLGDIDYVAFYDKPFLKFERLLETYITNAPQGFQSFRSAMPVWLREKLFLKRQLSKALAGTDHTFRGPSSILFSEHHYSHAASAFFPSPFEEAVVLTLDGVGEWATTTVAIGRGNTCEILKEIHFPHSLGLLYSAFTYYTGFKVNSGEYKLMGLAPYGQPVYKALILEHLIDLRPDGSFQLDQKYFDYATGLRMTNDRFAGLFGQMARTAESDSIETFHMDIAASIQEVTEEVVLTITRALAEEYAIPNLCLAGGVALNCVANGRIQRDGAFPNLWIQPAAGDAGGAVGAALAAYHRELGGKRVVKKPDSMRGSFLGPAFDVDQIDAELRSCGAVFETFDESQMLSLTADALAEGKAVGWFQGRMEFGPRALGARSILADPRSASMQRMLNLKIKYRESFRPFAPSVLAEDAEKYFNLSVPSPYMLLVAAVNDDLRSVMTPEEERLLGLEMLNVARSTIPAVTHVDYSARVQTVDASTNPLYHALLAGFRERTGCSVLVNTSFNVRGEPIVGSPTDAFRCFMATELDLLVVGGSVLYKGDQDPSLRQEHQGRYELD
ncbi:MAG: carbamoyltransferase [Acidimicrobiales bacterium]|nr:carbamoyltransferase [Acidimicrobiales bacterium]